jgi:predicted nucleic acid-binding protein
LIYFLDASALVKRYVQEEGSAVVRQLLGRELAVSGLSSVEVPAAVWRRARDGDLEPGRAAEISRQLEADLPEMIVVEVRRNVLTLAAELVERRPLRAYDSVQLACALRLKKRAGLAITMVGADRSLLRTASAEGLKTLRS